MLPYMYIILTGATNDHRSLIECKIFISCSDSRHLKNDRRDSNKKLIHGMIRNHTDNNFIVLNERKTRNVYIFMTFCLKLWLICYYLLSTQTVCTLCFVLNKEDLKRINPISGQRCFRHCRCIFCQIYSLKSEQ